MFAKIQVLIIFCFSLNNIKEMECLSRIQIPIQFKPTLDRLRIILNEKNEEAFNQTKYLTTQINTNLETAKNLTKTNIKQITDTIAQAEKVYARNPTKLACIRNQKSEAARLTVNEFNPCSASGNLTLLSRTRLNYVTLADVSGKTINYCQLLNPLESQNESLQKCVSDKVIDLNWQINLIQEEYDRVSNATLAFSVDCIMNAAGNAFLKIGQITFEGVTCLSREITDEYRVIVEELKRKILELYRSTGERTILTRNLIYKNIADSRNSTTHQIQNTRNLLIQARAETKTSPIHVQTCVSSQNFELSKIFPQSLINCNANSNFTQSTIIRNKILKLEQSATGLITTCTLLNPIRSDVTNTNLKICVESKVQEIRLQLLLVEKEFETHLQSIVNYSVNCILRSTNAISERIGIVVGAVKNCRNVKTPLRFV